MHVPRAPVASCGTHARMHDAARATRVAAGARRVGRVCTHTRVRCASYCRMRTWVPGLPACMAYVCVSGTLCSCACFYRTRCYTHTHTHTHTQARAHALAPRARRASMDLSGPIHHLTRRAQACASWASTQMLVRQECVCCAAPLFPAPLSMC